LNLWKAKNLTLIGRITILKCIILPKLFYKFSLLPCNINLPFIKSLNRIIYGLILGLKWERIRRINLARNIEEGGAKMLYLSLIVFRLQWKQLSNFVDVAM